MSESHSLLCLVEGVVERLSNQAKLEVAPPPVELHVVSVNKVGKSAGVVHDLMMRDLRPKKAANRMRDEMIPKLRKLLASGDVDTYRIQAHNLCTEFRIIVERCVEKVLLNDILQRFRRSVETKNKIGSLAKIRGTDCGLIDDFMTRYSVFEHSQAEEMPATEPDIDSLEADVKKLADWIAEFEARPVSASV